MTRRSRRRGFSLLEAVLALVLATLLFGGISLYTGTWLRQWEGIVERGGRDDTVAVVLDRIVEDLEAAQPIHADGPGGRRVSFEGGGDTVVFLRPALGFDARAGLDRIAYVTPFLGGTSAITRSRRDHGGSGRGGEDLPLMRGAMRLRFSYAGEDGVLSSTWNDAQSLPAFIRVEISGDHPQPWAEAAFARLRIRMPANCGTPDMLPECREHLSATR